MSRLELGLPPFRHRDGAAMESQFGRFEKGAVSASHLVLIPSYNTGAKLFATVAAALRCWQPVWVVIDGSSDGSGDALAQQARHIANLRVLCRSTNGGKGAAVLEGLRAADAAGFTHVLIMDADGQHPAESIAHFMALAHARPDTMILGVPVFDKTAPRIRVIGRRVSNSLARLETLGAIGDSLFGFRVYPLAALRALLEESRCMRGFDFDIGAAVRLSWRGCPAINIPAPVRYFSAAEGGVSHFRYARDNFLLARMHMYLLAGFVLRLPQLIARRLRSSRH